jgi:Fe2+ or Zn2+ uptake regulation protein
MDENKKRQDRLAATRERARVSPVRSWILDRLEKDHGRSIDPGQLLEEMNSGRWQVTLSQVNYHLRWLADAELIPAPCHGG